jgi:hypothetical protein
MKPKAIFMSIVGASPGSGAKYGQQEVYVKE